MYRLQFLEKLDEVCDEATADTPAGCPDSDYFSALGQLIAEKCELNDEQKAELVFVLGDIPASPSAARQALHRYRFPPKTGSRGGRKISL